MTDLIQMMFGLSYSDSKLRAMEAEIMQPRIHRLKAVRSLPHSGALVEQTTITSTVYPAKVSLFSTLEGCQVFFWHWGVKVSWHDKTPLIYPQTTFSIR